MLPVVRIHPALLMPWLLLLLAGCPTLEPEPDPPDDLLDPFDPAAADRLDEALDDLVEDFGAPGIQAAVSLPGTEPWLGWSGVSDLDSGQPLTAGDEQLAGSVTKTLTAALTLDLVHEGLVGLDDPVLDHLPDFPWGGDVTVRHLLQHTSGIPEYFARLELEGTLGDVWTLEELATEMATDDLAFEPGAQWSYSNTNYVLLGLVAEAATGETWDQRGTDLLTRAGCEARLPGDGWGDVIPGYLLLESGDPYDLMGETDMSRVVHPSSLGPAGDLVAEASHLVRWATSFWADGAVVPAELVAEAVADPFPVQGNMDYGLGVMLRGDDHGTEWFHNGAVYGYVAWLGWRPADGAALALLSNAWVVEDGQITPYWSTDAAGRLWDALYGD